MAERQQVRNLGSNYTTFRYNGQSIAYLESVADSGVSPRTSPEFIHPLGYTTPQEIVAPRTLTGGTLTVQIREVWHKEVWEHLAGLAGTTDVVGIFQRLAAMPNYITCTKIITPPWGPKYGKTYHRCLVYGIPSDETFQIDTMSNLKNIQIAYTHTTPL